MPATPSRTGKTWPSIPRTLFSRLQRAATFLRTGGIHIDCDQKVGRTCTRMITISTGLDHRAQPCVRMVRAVRTGAGVGGVRGMWQLDTADGSAS